MGEKQRVVLAEDDRDIRNLVTRTLEGEFDVEGFGNGAACWDHLAAGQPPDVLLLDVVLPGMDGPEVYERVRESDRLVDVSVIFLTGRDESDIAVADETVGYMAKPFSPGELRERLRSLAD